MTDAMKRVRINHDMWFKWLIKRFVADFFDYFFPDMNIGNYVVLDKEFHEEGKDRQGASKESDLFLAVEAEVEGDPRCAGGAL